MPFAPRDRAIGFVVFLSAVSLPLSACKKDVAAQADASPAPSASAAPSKAVDLDAFLKDPAAPLTPELEEALLLSFEKCKLKECKPYDSGIETSCEASKNYLAARAKSPSLTPAWEKTNEVGAKYIEHPSPAVRYQAVNLFFAGPNGGENAAHQATLLAAAKKEKDPGVLGRMLQALGPAHGKNDEIKSLLLESADHPADCVRTQAMAPLVSPAGKNVSGTFEKVAAKLESDPSEKVRYYLCSSLYGSENEKALPLLEKYLTKPGTPDNLFSGCFAGALAGWVAAAPPANPNKTTYELTMKVLEATPRTTERPPWVQISTLRHAKTEFKPGDHLGPEWFAKVKPWYNQGRLETALENIVTDPKAHFRTRNAAVEVLSELGAPKAKLLALSKKVGALKGDDASVKTSLDAAVAKAK